MEIPAEVEKRIQESLGSYCSSLHISICKLLISAYGDDEDNWRDPSIVGYLTLFVSRKLKTTAIRIYDIHTFDILFEIELYYNFEPYLDENQQQIAILQHELGSFCFLFCDETQGADFYGKILSTSQKMKNEVVFQKEKKNQKKKKGGLFSFFKRKDKKSDDISFSITGPSHFEHVQHGYPNADTSMAGISPPLSLATKKKAPSPAVSRKSLSYLKTDDQWDSYISSIDFDKSPMSSNTPLNRISYDSNLHFILPETVSRPQKN
ncbi:hypothetical protein WA158_002460 [Blastocystis sp. Blastoise]